jgi:hypothetical protein
MRQECYLAAAVKRVAVVLAVLGLVAAVTAGTALALRFTDDAYIWEDGEVGTPYFKQVNAAAGCPPYKFRVLAGALPDGLTIASDGRVTGTPLRLGKWNFWLELRGSGCPIDKPAEREFSMSVTRIKVTVKTEVLPDAFRDAAYPTQRLSAIGGTSTGYTWKLNSGSLPAGLTLNADGTITGTPTANGVSIFTVLVTDSAGKSDTKQLSITVVDPLRAALSRRVAEVGVPVSVTVKPYGGTAGYKVSVAGLPADLTFDAGSGAVTGVPTARGAFPLAIKVTDAHGLTSSSDRDDASSRCGCRSALQRRAATRRRRPSVRVERPRSAARPPCASPDWDPVGCACRPRHISRPFERAGCARGDVHEDAQARSSLASPCSTT